VPRRHGSTRVLLLELGDLDLELAEHREQALMRVCDRTQPKQRLHRDKGEGAARAEQMADGPTRERRVCNPLAGPHATPPLTSARRPRSGSMRQ
jgi:hypothetical protein